ncbi:MAG: YraN family protein [Pseudomonadota bacterium]|nr:YraN family protein [Pseudomonadota bacterium]
MSLPLENRRIRGHKSWERGHVSETLCRWALRLKGWRILASRWRTPLGEIDLVARRGNILVMVEVKARPSRVMALEAIHPVQQQRLARAAQVFLAAHPHLADLPVRFDAMLVVPRRWPCHVPDAWHARE